MQNSSRQERETIDVNRRAPPPMVVGTHRADDRSGTTSTQKMELSFSTNRQPGTPAEQNSALGDSSQYDSNMVY
jgi:hypothetical protein